MHREWNETFISVHVKCYFPEHQASPFDIVSITKNLRLNIGIVHSLTISNCYTASNYTHLFSHSLGISTFAPKSKLKFLTNRRDKHAIIHLREDSFSSSDETFYSNIDCLYLHEKGIHSISQKTFRYFNGLIELRIYNTALTHLPRNLLSDLPHLQIIKIFQNDKLVSIPAEIFAFENSIESVELTHNELLRLLPGNLLKRLTQLKELNIGSNNFGAIPSDLLTHNCDNLVKLGIKEDLYQCKGECFRKLPPQLIQNCVNLEEFEYSIHKTMNTNFLSIPTDFFEFQNKKLRKIVLDNANVPEDKLFNLFFTDSELKSSLVKLDYLSIEGNNIDCKLTHCDTDSRDHCDCSLVAKIGKLADHIHGNYTGRKSKLLITCDNQVSNKSEALEQNVSVENVLEVSIPFCNRLDLTTIIFYVAGLAMMLLSLLIIVCAKEHILIWMYNHPCFSVVFEIKITATKCVCEMHIRHADCRMECFCRDAFISYSQADENFALLLRDNLEDSGNFGGPGNLSQKQMAGRSFSCLDHQRDWKAGKAISENIR